ncbi:carboxylesterase/lipase family protein [Roseateles sp.]|uniref:carboxylesterase/lipase family protein n=1 Tax=Roseateles sp. TaxID=1971397 RepID=UPI002869EF4C|nr:carboxylesterase family protein [Roseateles sp.]
MKTWIARACLVGALLGGGIDKAAAAPATAPAAAAAPASTLLRQTAYGPVLGAEAGGAYVWLGLPYARPPLGALRWRAPEPPEPWVAPRAALRFGPSCAQAGRYYSPAPDEQPFGLAVREGFGKPVGSEDCLSLNIWRPANAATQLPVLVFIHGGSNISGYSADPSYEGQALALKANAVVVSINYRLGLFGWLNLPALKTGSALDDSGNFANLDQLAALRFVQNNIEAFGGAAGNVTLVGQSAGAINTWALLVSPLATGLFHKAAPLSGGLLFSSTGAAQSYAERLLAAALQADGLASDAATASAYIGAHSKAELSAYLRAKPAEALLKLVIANPAWGSFPNVIKDGHVVPLDPLAQIHAGRYARLPLLVGNTRDEGKLFGPYKPSDYQRFGLQYGFNPDALPSLVEADLLAAAMLPVAQAQTGWNAVSARTTDGLFTPLANQALAAVAGQQSALWVYRFDWDRQPPPFNSVYGAAHAVDLPFLFGNFGPSIFSFGHSAANRPGRLALAEQMQLSLAAFARSGDPNHAGLGQTWPVWPKRLIFNANDRHALIGVQ